MLHRSALAGLISLIMLACLGCETLIAAYLIRELLNDEAPRRWWRGVVRDTSAAPVEGVLVQVVGEVAGDADVMHFDDTTDADGKYEIRYRWNDNVEYTLRVVHEGVVFFEQDFGTIDLKDMETDIVIQGAVSTVLSGVVRDWQSRPVDGALVVGGSATALGASPVVLLDTGGGPQYVVTNESGVFQLEGSVGRYGIVCAYHPDYGFAYAYGEDTDSDGSLPLSPQLGQAGIYDVYVQVTDAGGTPIASQILAPERQFRLRCGTPFNFGSVVDDVVADEELFPGLVGSPSAAHPATVTLTVQATGANGIAENVAQVRGGTYDLTLLNVPDDDPATALVQSDNPLVLHTNTTVVVRVN